MNKHIELVKKFLADPQSVTPEELKANYEAAESAAGAAADATAYAAAAADATAYAAAGAAASALYWVRRYEALTGGE